mgnify:CR=1 FL=1
MQLEILRRIGGAYLVRQDEAYHMAYPEAGYYTAMKKQRTSRRSLPRWSALPLCWRTRKPGGNVRSGPKRIFPRTAICWTKPM